MTYNCPFSTALSIGQLPSGKWTMPTYAVAVLHVATEHYTLYRIPIPIYCDNS